MRPSSEKVTTCQGMNFPERLSASVAMRSRPPQQGTSIRQMVTLLNFPMIDGDLADLAVEFWNLTWNDERRHLPQETRLLLSMANALGAGRMRQASRELIKVYALGCDSGALDDVMELVAWNQGIGTFASEVGPSTFFRAYRTIKEQEAKGKPRSEIVGMLMERFGEQNPDVGVQ